MATYYIKKSSDNQYYWVLDSDKNGKTVCMSSELYVSKQGAENSIIWNQLNGKTAKITDLT